jgi:hypothetical protein
MKKILNYTQFNESRSTEIPTDELEKHLNGINPGFNFKTDGCLWRGHNNRNEDILLTDPTTSYRKSKDSPDYYNMIIDNSPRWAKFPKRSNSIIATTSKSTASLYGSLYGVVAAKDAVFGVAPAGDIWESFHKSEDKLDIKLNMDYLVRYLDVLLKMCIDTEYTYTASTFDQLMSYLEILDSHTIPEQIKMVDEGVKKHRLNTINVAEFKKLINIPGKWFDKLDDYMDPDFNGFELVKFDNIESIKDFKVLGRETWTDSQCLLVKEKILIDRRYFS